jgi:hypothetical protein
LREDFRPITVVESDAGLFEIRFGSMCAPALLDKSEKLLGSKLSPFREP